MANETRKIARFKRHSVLPGFGLTLGFTMTYLSLIVLIPLAGLFLKSFTISWPDFWSTVTDPQVVASYKLTFGASLVGASLNAVFGLTVAWVLVRYSFPGKKIIDALVDLPFAMPTAVSGIVLTSLYLPNGWFGRWLAPLGIEVKDQPLGVVVALTFIGLPFVVRTLQPALEDLETGVEEAAASLGATRLQTFWHVILPIIFPAWLTGFALAFARALGEYGSVVFIYGFSFKHAQITPQVIFSKLEENTSVSYAQASAIAVVTLVASFVILLVINLIQWWSRRFAA
jgi:sulfate/thiosulfate transport system permease protein